MISLLSKCIILGGCILVHLQNLHIASLISEVRDPIEKSKSKPQKLFFHQDSKSRSIWHPVGNDRDSKHILDQRLLRLCPHYISLHLLVWYLQKSDVCWQMKVKHHKLNSSFNCSTCYSVLYPLENINTDSCGSYTAVNWANVSFLIIIKWLRRSRKQFASTWYISFLGLL